VTLQKGDSARSQSPPESERPRTLAERLAVDEMAAFDDLDDDRPQAEIRRRARCRTPTAKRKRHGE